MELAFGQHSSKHAATADIQRARSCTIHHVLPSGDTLCMAPNTATVSAPGTASPLRALPDRKCDLSGGASYHQLRKSVRRRPARCMSGPQRRDRFIECAFGFERSRSRRPRCMSGPQCRDRFSVRASREPRCMSGPQCRDRFFVRASREPRCMSGPECRDRFFGGCFGTGCQCFGCEKWL